MDQNLSVDNPGATETDNLTSEPVPEVAGGTDTTNGQAQGGAPGDDIFKGIDPNRLTPNEKALYNSMLTDYREKTAKISETIKSESAKQAEAFKSKAELYDQFAKEEQFVNKWNEYVQQVQAQQSSGQPSGANDPLQELKAQLQEVNQKVLLSEMNQITDAFIEAVDEKGQPMHPEFDQLNNIMLGSLQQGQSAEEFSLLRACIELAPGNSPQEKLANGYKSAKASYAAIFEAGKKAGMGRLQTKMQNGTLPPSAATGEVLTLTDKKPKTAREALEMAKRGIVVSR